MAARKYFPAKSRCVCGRAIGCEWKRPAAADTEMFSFWREADRAAKRALIAASLGWMLDAFDVMLYALVAASIIQELKLEPATAGWIASVTLIAAAAGGIV